MKRAALAAVLTLALSGCAVISIAGTAASVAATVVGAAVDVAVGAVKLTGKAVGSAVDAVRGQDKPTEAKKADEPPANK